MSVIQSIIAPMESVNDQTLVVVAVPFKNNDLVKAGDSVIELETSKATFTIEAEHDGYVKYLCELDDEVQVNHVIVEIYDSPLSGNEQPSPSENGVQATNGTTPSLQVQYETPPASKETAPQMENTLFSNAARKLMQQNNLSEADFVGRDLITARDVMMVVNPAAVKEREMVVKAPPPKSKAPKIEAAPKEQENVIFQKLSADKRREIQYLESVQTAGLNSMVNTFVDCKGIFKFINPKMTVIKNSLLPIIALEVSRLLKKHEVFNAYFENGHIGFYQHVDVGIAMDIGNGLKVVRLQDTDRMTLPDIEQSLIDLSEKYMDNSLKIGDLTPITFTITDLAAEGVAFFSPLINMNNSAILGVSQIDAELQRMVLTLTFDHRITEGKTAAVFLRELKERIEAYRNEGDASVLAQGIKCRSCFKSLEEDMSGIGFVKSLAKDGTEGYLCQNCIKGF